MKRDFLSEFFKVLGGTAMEMGEAFTLDFYLHRGRRYNLCWPDDHERFKKGIYNLKRSGYIKPTKNNLFKFTRKGKKWYIKNINKQSPLRELDWDKKWRVVFFDIPEELHKKRNIFRYRLKNLGFYQLQKSTLVLPFKCENEVAEICSKLKISQYVDMIIADSVGSKEDEIKKTFNL